MATNCPINATPLAEAEVINNPGVVNLNYTNQSFWTMKTRIVDLVNEKFGPSGTELPNTFNDFVEGSIAIMLMEVFAFLADTLSFKIDQNANEIYIDTVTELENAFRLAKVVGFEPTPPICARSRWSATLNAPLPNDAILFTPLPIDVTTDTGVPIVIELFPCDPYGYPILNEDIIIPAGATENSAIIGLEGQTFTDVFNGTGEISQTIQLINSPVLFDSIRVSVDGVLWDRVDFFSDSQPRKEYRIEFNSNYEAFAIFGNNRAGVIPSRGSRIQVIYRVGGGTRGNIITGFITTPRQAAVPGLEFNVPVSLRNYTKGEFGYNGDTIEDIRRKLPAYIRTQNRAVTGLDYQTIANQFVTPYQGQIGKAAAILRNYGCSGNIIDLYVLGRDGENLIKASNELKAALNVELEDKKMLTDYVCIRDGNIVLADISIEAVLDKAFRKFEPEVKENINRRVNTFFTIPNWNFGQSLKVNELVKILSDIKEVQSFDITFTTSDSSGTIVSAKFFEIIRPDTIDINFLYT